MIGGMRSCNGIVLPTNSIGIVACSNGLVNRRGSKVNERERLALVAFKPAISVFRRGKEETCCILCVKKIPSSSLLSSCAGVAGCSGVALRPILS